MPLSGDQLDSVNDEHEAEPMFNFNYMTKCQDSLNRIKFNQTKDGIDHGKTQTSLLPLPD